jgi:hypothetical protein
VILREVIVLERSEVSDIMMCEVSDLERSEMIVLERSVECCPSSAVFRGD